MSERDYEMPQWNEMKHKGWQLHRELTIKEVRDIKSKFQGLDREMLRTENPQWDDKFEEMRNKFDITRVLTKEDEKWLDRRVRYQDLMRRLAKSGESIIGRKAFKTDTI